jgi:hypothetical protein
MATGTLNTDVYQNQVDSSNDLAGAADRASGYKATGQVLYHVSTVTTTAIDLGSTINIGKIPIGSIVVPCLSWVEHGAVGTSVTFNIGDSADADRYATLIDVAAAGITQFDAPLTTEYSTLSTTNTIICTTAGATMDAGIDVKFVVAYRTLR